MWAAAAARLGWPAAAAAVATVAAIDGAFLGGVAAIITAIGGVVLGVLAFWKGKQAASGPTGDSVADAWKSIAEERDREVRELRRQLVAERRRHGGR